MFDSRLFISFNTSRSAAGNTSRPATSSSFSLLKRSTVFTVCALVCTFALTRVRGFQDAPVQLNGFVQQARLTANDGEGSDQLGRSVAVSGDTVLVGVPGDNEGALVNQGAAYVFRRTGTTWAQEAKLLANDGQNGDAFGQSVALDGDVAVIGAAFDDKPTGNNAGSVYVYRRTGTTWAFEQRLVPNDAQANDHFGNAVSVVGDTILIGASLKDIGANTDQGAAYVFKRAGGVWSQQTRLTAGNGAAADEFGDAVG